MAVLEKAKSFLNPEAQQIPSRVKQRLNRGRLEMLRDANKRRLCMRFERGETWWFINEKNVLIQQDTVTFAGGKPPYRMRNTHNFIRPIVEGKVSWATQRIPGYEVLPTATDPDKVAAAKLAEQVLMYGYDKWGLREMSIDLVKLAISGGGEAFAMPYFDPNVGPYHFVKDPNGKATDPQTGEAGKWVGEGEIKVKVFNGNEVYWEPGVSFNESRWWATEQAVPVDVVKEYEGYIGGDLSPDAASSDIPRDSKPHGNLVMVVEYYERPCPDYPRGRKIRLASGRIITPPEDYPLLDSKNQVLDEPVIHRLVYTHDPDGKRDLGLVWQLIDPQRTAQDCMAGETLVQTSEGLRYARDLAGQTVDTLTADGTYRPARWENYGARRLWRVGFDNGEELFASENHEWIVNAPGAGNTRKVRTTELLAERVPLVSRTPRAKIESEAAWTAGVQNGLVYGDGHVARRKGRRDYGYLVQYTDDGCELIERFFPDRHGERKQVKGRTQLSTRTLDPDLKRIPSLDESDDYLRGFIAGALAADGGVNTQGAVRLFSANQDDLHQIAQIARSVGIVVTGIKWSRGGTNYKADAELFSLGLAKGAFMDGEGVNRDLILRDYHAGMLERSLKSGGVRITTRRVVSVEPTNRVEDTFCCVEPVTHSWVTGNGLVTGNCWNKLLEWKNRCLNPQMMAPIGANLKRPDDTPGRINYYRPVSGQVPQWEKPPQIPAELFQMIDRARSEMRDISSDEQIEAAPNLAAATIQQVLEVSRARWGSFLGDYAGCHSGIGRHCLFLVQRHYTEERDLQIRGAYSPYPIKAFIGSKLLDQQDVRVQPQSLQVRTRDQLHKDVMEFAQLGWIAPEQAMAAISGGVGVEKLVESYELDIARVNRIIQKIRDGSVMEMKTRPGTPDTAPMNPDGSPVVGPDGQPEPPPEVPGWMPDEQDKLPVWKWVLSDWMKTDEFDQLDPQYQEVAHLMFQGIQDLEAKAAQRAQMLQAAQAEQLGMNNAAKPQSKGMPSLPGGGPAGPQPPPQNQPQGASQAQQ